jgi:hypothetical protein
MIEVLKQALEVIETAIKAGDWKVDGACDPDNVIHGLRQAIAELESQEPVAWADHGVVNWIADKQFKHASLLYTIPPKSFTYEQVKAHIRAASMSANDIAVGSDVTNDGVSIVIRRRDEILYEEFFAHPPQRTWIGLTDDELTDLFYNTNLGQASAVAQAIALLKEKNT